MRWGGWADIISPRTGIRRRPTGSTPRNASSKASAPSRGGEPSSLNRTRVRTSLPANRTQVRPISISRTSPCANWNSWLIIGAIPNSRNADAGADMMDAPVSTSALNGVQRSPFRFSRTQSANLPASYPRAPFCVVFTLWLSIMAAPGLASRHSRVSAPSFPRRRESRGVVSGAVGRALLSESGFIGLKDFQDLVSPVLRSSPQPKIPPT